MLTIVRRLSRSQRGTTSLEYALVASLIAVAAITAMNAIDGNAGGSRPYMDGAATSTATK